MNKKYINVRFKIAVNPKASDKQIQNWLDKLISDNFIVIGDIKFFETTLTQKEESLYSYGKEINSSTN